MTGRAPVSGDSRIVVSTDPKHSRALAEPRPIASAVALRAETALLNLGITFNVYGAEGATERIFPFDLMPRIIEPEDWRVVERGLEQRVTALNAFCDDIYHDQKIVADGVVPEEIVRSATGYLPECEGLNPPRGVWCHITGSDLVRDADGQFYVLEDNLRCPSGVSYVLENRQILKRTFHHVFEASGVRPVEDYPSRLLEMLNWIAPPGVTSPTVAVLTPGVYNSAYFEHSFLAQQMGVELVEGRDLLVNNGFLCMRTTRGFQRVDVLYRRVADDFLDPLAFRPESLLGVPGLLDVYRAGRLGIANAPGTGVADDKVIYAFVPKIVRYYLGEDMILPRAKLSFDRLLKRLNRAGLDSDFVITRLIPRSLRARLEDPGARPARPARGEACQRVRRQRHPHRPPRHARHAGGVRPPDLCQPPQLHRPADARPFPCPRDRGGPLRAPTCRPAPLRAPRRGALRAAGRAHPGRPAARLAGGELLAGRGQQGHVGPRRVMTC